jgi:hypothetical protein
MVKSSSKFIILNFIAFLLSFGVFYGGVYHMTELIKVCSANEQDELAKCMTYNQIESKKFLIDNVPILGIALFLIGNPILIVLTLAGIKSDEK